MSVSIADSIINFALSYDQSRLKVCLGRATNLPKEFHKPGMHCDSFVVLHLEPSREETFKSKVIKGTIDPEFHQTFHFERMSEESIKHQTLILRMYNRALNNKTIGKGCLPISEVELSGTRMRTKITSTEEMEVCIIVNM
jgi:Ca2+-dependent lipid-binding protein